MRRLLLLLLFSGCARRPPAAPADVTADVLGAEEEGAIAYGCVDQVRFDRDHAYYLIGSRSLLASSKRGGPARTLLQSSGYVRYAVAPDGVWATDGAKIHWIGHQSFDAEPGLIDVAADATAIYWQAAHGLVRMSREGGARQALATGTIRGWVLTGASVVAAIDGMLVDLHGDARETIGAIGDGYVARADEQWVYFHANETLYRMHRKGSAPTVVAKSRLFSFAGDRAYYAAGHAIRSVRTDGADDRDEHVPARDITTLHVDPPFAYTVSLRYGAPGCTGGAIVRHRLRP